MIRLLMRPVSLVSLFLSMASAHDTLASPESATRLWFTHPAAAWTEALPIGNGRLGAMVFGHPTQERIQFNEDTRWSGGPYDPVPEGAAAHLGEVRAAIFAGEYKKAHKLFGRHLMGTPVEQQKYQSFGDLILSFDEGEVTHYRRDLDLDTAIATTHFTRAGVSYSREAFVSPIDQVIVVRLTADQPGAITFEAELRGIRNTQHSNYGNGLFRMDGLPNKRLRLHGRSADYLGIEGRQRYEAQLDCSIDGGRAEIVDDRMVVTGANHATLYLAAATNFKRYNELGPDPRTTVENTLDSLEPRSFETLREAHVQEHRRLFRRVAVDLGTGPESHLPTDERLARNARGEDPALAALVMQFGRYLLITSSRPGTQPANLQGIWNEEMNPKWDSKYTININVQMNYWPAEPGNLSECTEPLFRMVSELSETGTRLARELYDCRGWVTHQNTDLWRAGAPMDGPNWGAFTVGGAWLATHLWEHQSFHPNREVLAAHYPLMKGNAEFFLDYLVPHPDTGLLVTCPSTSPENSPGRVGNDPFFDELCAWLAPGTTLCAGSTIDQQIVRDVFDHVAQASALLEVDEAFRTKVLEARSRLAPTRIGRHGEIQEWLEDWPQSEKSHRHISPLYGLFPGNQIGLHTTPQLAEAAAVVLEQRGLEGNGWSSAWKAACWARLGEPEKALAHFDHAITHYTLPNLFSVCSRNMQVDGSHGFSAAIMEMLLQSQGGELQLLPCLPARWPAGTVTGLRARGGYQVDLAWAAGQLQEATLTADCEGTCRIRTAIPLEAVGPNGAVIASSKDGFLHVPTRGGETYRIRQRG